MMDKAINSNKYYLAKAKESLQNYTYHNYFVRVRHNTQIQTHNPPRAELNEIFCKYL